MPRFREADVTRATALIVGLDGGRARFLHGPAHPAYAVEMGRLFAATGDAIVRLEETGGTWVASRSLDGSGAQCLAVDPHTPDSVFAGLREGGVRRSDDGGGTWVDCELPEPGVFSLAVSAADGTVYAGTEPSRLFASRDRGETWEALDALLELPVSTDLELPAATVDVARALDRAEPARREPAARRDRARRADALHRRRQHLGGPPARRAARRALPRVAPACRGSRLRGGRRRRRVQRGRRRDVAAGRRGPRPPLHLGARGRPRRPGPLVRLGQHRALRRARPRRAAGAHLPSAGGEPWVALSGGLPEPLPAMPYALLARAAVSSRAWRTGSSGRAATAATAGSACRSSAAPTA